jgi:DegV family protein with EDD domain
MVRIICDSTSDLDKDLVARYGIRVVPMTVIHAGREYKDGVDLDTPGLFALVRETGQLPTTAAPSTGEFLQAFDPAEEPICLTISSKLSASNQNARLASAERAGGVRVIDSLNLSTGIGLLVLLAAELRDQGKSAEEIEQAVLAAVPKVRTSFVIETMEYLYKGGRCTAVQALVGSLLKIRPIIAVRPDGTLGVKEKTRGTRKKALDALLAGLEAHISNLDRHRVFVTHTGCDADAEYLVGEIKRIAAPEQVFVTTAGAVVASHCGPDTIGILYLLKEVLPEPSRQILR